jgi:hypothetical protein
MHGSDRVARPRADDGRPTNRPDIDRRGRLPWSRVNRYLVLDEPVILSIEEPQSKSGPGGKQQPIGAKPIWQYRYEKELLFFTEKIAHPHDGIDLFLTKERQEVLPDRGRVYRASGVQLFPAQLCKHHENSLSINGTTFDEFSFLHSRQLVRKPTLVPGHQGGQRLLTHFTFAYGSETRQYTKLGT